MKKLVKSLVTLAAVAIAMLAMTTGVFAAETLTATNKYYGNEAGATKTYTYTNNDKLSDSSSYYGVVIPVKATSAGTIRLDLTFVALQADVSVDVYSDAACTNRIEYGNSYKIGEVSGTEYVPITNPGTYYVKLESYVSSYPSTPVFANTINVSASVYTRADKTIKSGQTITYYRNSGSDVYWFKYKAEKTGKATVSVTKEYGSYITLANSKKKALSEEEWVSDMVGNYQMTFAVKKGTTYYFKVTAIGDELHTFSVKNTAVKEKSGAKKKKAVNVKAKKKAKGTIAAGEKKADWYKFSVKKKKAVTFTLDGDVTGSVIFTVYTKKGKKVGSYTWNGGKQKLKLTHSTTYGKVDKGTYYIKISRSNATSSGAYTFKWK